MYAFSTVDFDLEGHVLVDDAIQENQVHDFSRRVSRVKTLDGGVVVSDTGYASGDRTIKLAFKNLPEDEFQNLKRLLQTYSDYIVCTPEGVFTAVGQDFRVLRGTALITFFLTGDA